MNILILKNRLIFLVYLFFLSKLIPVQYKYKDLCGAKFDSGHSSLLFLHSMDQTCPRESWKFWIQQGPIQDCSILNFIRGRLWGGRLQLSCRLSQIHEHYVSKCEADVVFVVKQSQNSLWHVCIFCASRVLKVPK